MGTAMPPLCSPAHSDGGSWAVCPTRRGQGTGAVCACGGRGVTYIKSLLKDNLTFTCLKSYRSNTFSSLRKSTSVSSDAKKNHFAAANPFDNLIRTFYSQSGSVCTCCVPAGLTQGREERWSTPQKEPTLRE